ncbi:MAG: Glycosyl transferases group 1 [Candidatus Methanofastidiosum methylothiophilum]|uniref:Glycosyl transferases group 1 n=1 Tax=Candidatus Methanofastidiosum methylothiophilum TaxID=1705564 RepID=A0A150J295_9EURY|nr:MAG: Glycosyl transferases group 1 [Candidatus Methanofastidiosum methylthiophilus]
MSILRILYPPTVNYNILFQRPNQVLKVLSREGHTCYFMNHIPGIKGQYVLEGIEELEKNFYIVSNMVHPATLNPDVYYFSYPPYYDWINRIKPEYVIFDALDSPTGEFSSWKPEWEKSVKRADLVLAVSTELYKEVKKLNDNVLLVKNGVDYDHYQQATRNPYRKLKLPGFQRKNPVVGFSGAIASWVNLELLYRSCLEYPDFNFVILGLEYNVKLKRSIGRPDNLFFLGHVPYDDLPMWVNHFDVCTIPFRDNQVTRACNPLKFWEYMATGNPVVTSNLPETYYEGVYWAKTDEEYISYIGDAMVERRNHGDKLREVRKKVAYNCSWEKNLEPVIEQLQRWDKDGE